MKTELSSEQIQSYRENGFLPIEGFLSPAELETWRRVTDHAVAQRLGIGRPEGQTQSLSLNNQETGESYYRKVFTQCLRLADISSEMAGLVYDPKVGQMLATLAKVDCIRVWHDQALIKPPYGNPTGWHLDTPYWSFSHREALSIWVALDDATMQNGCMCYLPGTHKLARFDNSGIGPQLDALFAIYPEWFKIDPVAVPVKAGSMVIHNGLCAHGAGANMTNKPRRAMTCAYMPDGSTYNGTRNVLPDRILKTIQVGDPLNDPEQNPVIWSRSNSAGLAAGGD